MSLTKDSEFIRISPVIKKSQRRYLKSKGMNQSQFVRQAIVAQQEGKWDYKFIKEE